MQEGRLRMLFGLESCSAICRNGVRRRGHGLAVTDSTDAGDRGAQSFAGDAGVQLEVWRADGLAIGGNQAACAECEWRAAIETLAPFTRLMMASARMERAEFPVHRNKRCGVPASSLPLVAAARSGADFRSQRF